MTGFESMIMEGFSSSMFVYLPIPDFFLEGNIQKSDIPLVFLLYPFALFLEVVLNIINYLLIINYLELPLY